MGRREKASHLREIGREETPERQHKTCGLPTSPEVTPDAQRLCS